MSLSIVPLLVHSDVVPASAREELRAAIEAPLEARLGHLESAARILYDHSDLDCRDARELVGLSEGSCS